MKSKKNTSQGCIECGVQLSIGENWTASREKRGQYKCSPCVAAYHRSYREKNSASTNKSSNEYYYRNKDRISAREKAKREKNPGFFKARNSEYSKRNKGVVNAKTYRYRSSKLKRTPAWSDLDAITKIYVECPKGKEVDHIYPLQGERVSGLHVPENLQYLTRSENASKSNRYG